MSRLAMLFEPPADATPDELRARLRALADLVARAPVPIAVAHDAECRFISANDALARLLHLPPNANISLTPPRWRTSPSIESSAHGRDIRIHELPMQYAIAHRTTRHQRHRDRPAPTARWPTSRTTSSRCTIGRATSAGASASAST